MAEPPYFDPTNRRTKPLEWLGPSLKVLRGLPERVRGTFGFALYLAQIGDKHVSAKPLKGFAGAGVLEVVEDFDGDAFRAIYTIRFASAVYVLHIFQKKSKTGIKTPKTEIDLVQQRLKVAEELHRQKEIR